MSPKRSSSRAQQPAQRRPRAERACNHCRMARQRCEAREYGINDQPCRRCVNHDLDCNIPRMTRSQSPNLGSGVQGYEPAQCSVTPQSAAGATDDLAQSSEADVMQQPETTQAQGPVGRWPHMMRSEERHGSSTTILLPGQDLPQTPSFLPLASSMAGYHHQNFPNVATNPGSSSYYPQDYYGQTMTSYATQSGTDDASNLGYDAEEAQPGDTGTFADEQDLDDSLSRSGET